MDDETDPYGAINFGEFRQYMQNKQAKLKEQEDAVRQEGDPETLPLFQGLSIYVNGYTEPPLSELRRLIVQHSGDYQHYLKKSHVTHIIATTLTNAKMNEFRQVHARFEVAAYKVVKPAWLTESIAAGKVLPWTSYRVIRANQGQSELPFRMIDKGKERMTDADPQQQPLVAQQTSLPAQGCELAAKEPLSDEDDELPSGEMLNQQLMSSDWARQHSSMQPDFVKRYFQTSRLHYLSTWKAELKDIVRQARVDAEKAASSLAHSPSSVHSSPTHRIIMHIDFDCFFASVGTRDRPELAGKPVAVAHGKGHHENSSSDIASCNYIARSFGVCNGMRVGSAKQKCPELKTIPYEFEKYRSVSETLYNILFQYTHEIQAVSVDEALVDVSTLIVHPQLGEEQALADRLRAQIKEQTGCDVSIGMGPNILMARLATKKAKPNGFFCYHPGADTAFLASQSVHDLPGVGYAMFAKLQDMGVTTVGELATQPLSVLQAKFGNKTGTMLHDFARGKDDRPLVMDQPRQTVSAEVSWGVRFETHEQMETFLDNLITEVADRLQAIPTKGRHITLKVMVRAAHAAQAAKHMGHGECDLQTKSVVLASATNDTSVLRTHVHRLMNSLAIPVADIRGVGIQISKLDQDGDETDRNQLKLSFEKMKPHAPKIERDASPSSADPSYSAPNLSSPPPMTTTDSPKATSSKPKMVVQIDAFNELPRDIQDELRSMYDLEMMEVDQNASTTHVSSPPAASSMPRPPPPPPPPSADDAPPSTQLLVDLPTWSQLDPSALAALPPAMQQQVLRAYGALNAEHDPTIATSSTKSVRGSISASTRTKIAETRQIPPLSPSASSGTHPQHRISKHTHRRGGSRAGGAAPAIGAHRAGTLTQMFPSTARRLDAAALLDLQHMDMDVFDELPQDIKDELLAARRRLQPERTTGQRRSRPLSPPPRRAEPPSGPPKPVALKGKTGVQDVRRVLEAWVSEFNTDPDEKDVRTVSTFLRQLVADKDLEKAQLLFWHLRHITKDSGRRWQVALDRIKRELNDQAIEIFNAPIQL
ncbi:hypothetical protein BC940DRAFT_363262 [Gongronella butleri]|nr:hypothetical protein BC940DRAFT_363262 [Gongronella butleri]